MVFIVLLIFAMITTPYVNKNTPVYDSSRVERIDLKESELDGVYWGNRYNQNGLYVDHYVYERRLEAEAINRGGPTADIRLENYQDNFTFRKNSLVLTRVYITDRSRVSLLSIGEKTDYLRVDRLERAIRFDSRIYANGEVKIYYSRGSNPPNRAANQTSR
jgi:hypothetical protein